MQSASAAWKLSSVLWNEYVHPEYLPARQSLQSAWPPSTSVLPRNCPAAQPWQARASVPNLLPVVDDQSN